MTDSEAQTIQLLTDIRNDQREALEISRQVLELSQQAKPPWKKLAPYYLALFIAGMLAILAITAAGVWVLLQLPGVLTETLQEVPPP